MRTVFVEWALTILASEPNLVYSPSKLNKLCRSSPTLYLLTSTHRLFRDITGLIQIDGVCSASGAGWLVLASGLVLSFGYLWLLKSRWWQEPHLAKEVSAPHRNIGKLMMWLVDWRRKTCALCSCVTDLHSHWSTKWLDDPCYLTSALLFRYPRNS